MTDQPSDAAIAELDASLAVARSQCIALLALGADRLTINVSASMPMPNDQIQVTFTRTEPAS